MTPSELTVARTLAEESFLGAILIESTTGTKEAIEAVSPMCQVSDFYGYLPDASSERQPQRARIYLAMLNAVDPPHVVNAALELHRMGLLQVYDCAYLRHLVAMCPCSLDVVHYANAVHSFGGKEERRPRYKSGVA